MKKLAILTLNGYFNYGNRLQNYALQEVLRSLGFDVDTLKVEIEENQDELKKNSYMEKVQSLMNKKIDEVVYKIIDKVNYLLNKEEMVQLKQLRENAFLEFTNKYIFETDQSISRKYIPNYITDKYEYFVVGSDQVWNPFFPEVSEIYFLTFAPKKKRIAYAPSFGIESIPNSRTREYKEWIYNIESLSVREKAGAKIIKNLTGREAPVLVDPTLLLSQQQWLNVVKKRSLVEEKYLLTYFLGGIPKEYRKQIKSIAKKNNLKIVNLADIKDKETYTTGPSEFINYIYSCELFCTDSFHGAVFSILFEKPFIVYKRVGGPMSMYSRIDTLLNKFELNTRKYENININEDIFKMDYSHITPILEIERKKSFDYLKDVLNILDEA